MHLAALLKVPAAELAGGRHLPERREPARSVMDDAARALARMLTAPWHALAAADGLRRRPVPALLRAIETDGAPLATLDDAGLRERADALRLRLRREGFAVAPVAAAFAVVREAADRALGLRHHPNQLATGWWLLQGTLVEMATGEGKTMAATLPAATAALAGLPVHVITANDYLAARDAANTAALYAALGLSCSAACLTDGVARRGAAYAADIVYVSSQVLTFDYLRERAEQGQRSGPLHRVIDTGAAKGGSEPGRGMLRGLVYGIVDEADSIFIDEARTPLILSTRWPLSAEQQQARAAAAAAALALAGQLRSGLDYELLPQTRQARLTDAGHAAMLDRLPPRAHPREAEIAVSQALAALHLYRRDQHYIIVDGQVRIVDETTGRAMPDRSWERGLHQMVETKEGLALTAPTHTIARLTFQRFYRRYLRLAGMSGTVREAAHEIGRTYGLPMVRVPNHRPCARRVLPARCLPDQAAKWDAVVQEVRAVALRQGRPVLLGTRTVEASMTLSAHLHAAGIRHQVLNALQDADEAAVVASAGEAGRVTVATDMAGRGTDIRLGPGVAERGGLHVVLTEYAPLRRIDRQLAGRAGRQGDPGTVAACVAADDTLFMLHAPRLRAALRPLLAGRHTGPVALAILRWAAQGHNEALYRQMRRQGERHDREQARLLAFSGTGE